MFIQTVPTPDYVNECFLQDAVTKVLATASLPADNLIETIFDTIVADCEEVGAEYAPKDLCTQTVFWIQDEIRHQTGQPISVVIRKRFIKGANHPGWYTVERVLGVSNGNVFTTIHKSFPALTGGSTPDLELNSYLRVETQGWEPGMIVFIDKRDQPYESDAIHDLALNADLRVNGVGIYYGKITVKLSSAAPKQSWKLDGLNAAVRAMWPGSDVTLTMPYEK